MTIGGGAQFGAAGLILAAPLTSATVRISEDLSQARTAAQEPRDGAAGRTGIPLTE